MIKTLWTLMGFAIMLVIVFGGYKEDKLIILMFSQFACILFFYLSWIAEILESRKP